MSSRMLVTLCVSAIIGSMVALAGTFASDLGDCSGTWQITGTWEAPEECPDPQASNCQVAWTCHLLANGYYATVKSSDILAVDECSAAVKSSNRCKWCDGDYKCAVGKAYETLSNCQDDINSINYAKNVQDKCTVTLIEI